MRRAATLCLILAFPTGALAHHPLDSTCDRAFTAAQIARAAKKVWGDRSTPVTPAERRRVRFYRRCARSHRHARRGLASIYRWQAWRRR